MKPVVNYLIVLVLGLVCIGGITPQRVSADEHSVRTSKTHTFKTQLGTFTVSATLYCNDDCNQHEGDFLNYIRSAAKPQNVGRKFTIPGSCSNSYFKVTKVVGSCFQYNYCNGNKAMTRNSDCSATVAEECQYGCNNGQCNGALSASCVGQAVPREITGTNGPALDYKQINWIAYVQGGAPTKKYTWSGTDGLSGNREQVTKIYSTEGDKSATITVQSGGQSATAQCMETAEVLEDQCSNVNGVQTVVPSNMVKQGSSCVVSASCTEDVYTCSEWSACSNGTQTRSCTMVADCPNATTPAPAESQSCTNEGGSGNTDSNGTPQVTFRIEPNLIRKGQSCTLKWNVANVNNATDCTIFKNGEEVKKLTSGELLNGTYSTGAQEVTSQYTFSCSNGDGQPVVVNKKCTVMQIIEN